MATEAARTLSAQARQPGGMTLRTVEETTTKQADAIRSRVAASQTQSSRLKETADKLQDAFKKGDIDQVRIIGADFATARSDFDANERDLATVMMGLSQGFKDIGIAIEDAQKRSPAEQKLVDDANALVQRMEGRLASANLDLATAEKKSTLFGQRERAVAAANTAIAEAQKNVDNAKSAVVTAEQLADKQMRDRLENMNLEGSLQRLQDVTGQVLTIAKDRVGEIEGNIDAVEASRVTLVDDLKSFSVQIEQGDKDIAQAKAVLAGLADQQRELQENSSEWTTLQGQIKEKQNELLTIEAARNKAFALAQDGQRFLEMYTVQESSQRGLLQFHQIWIATLESGVEQRSVLYQSHVGILRAAGDQQAMGMIDRVATETDERITEDAAKHLSAIQNQMTDRLESMPGQVTRMRDITTAMAKGKAAFDSNMDKLRQVFNKNFETPQGYDSSDSYMPQPGNTDAPSQPSA